ncbi:sensor histidine kinase [Alsobacter sp. R-9]
MAVQWRALTVIQQFMLVSLCVVVAGMMVLGVWVSRNITESSGSNAATAAALYMNSMLAPHLTSYALTGRIDLADREALDEVTRIAQSQRQVFSIKIWSPDGQVVYATNRELEGARFEPGDSLRAAAGGRVAWEYDDHSDAENEHERASNIRFLEIYAPVRDDHGRIFAVAEFYENAQFIGGEVATARQRTWFVTALVSISTVLALYVIVARADKTIEQQREALGQRVSELSRLLAQNDELRRTTQRLSRHAAEENERVMGQLGADLHDGPAQLLALALLRLDPARATPERARDEIGRVRPILIEALEDMRAICGGLVMPGIRDIGPRDAFRFIVDSHERRTQTTVDLEVGSLPDGLPEHVKVCLCRVVQEGLTNAFRHAGGAGQSVSIRDDGSGITVEVSDRGPGPIAEPDTNEPPRMGLAGLRARLALLGGALRIEPRAGGGTTLTARLPYRFEEEIAHVA